MKLRGKAIRPSHFFDSILIQISVIEDLNDVFQEAGEQAKYGVFSLRFEYHPFLPEALEPLLRSDRHMTKAYKC
jgi:hypothetical protein